VDVNPRFQRFKPYYRNNIVLDGDKYCTRVCINAWHWSCGVHGIGPICNENAPYRGGDEQGRAKKDTLFEWLFQVEILSSDIKMKRYNL